MTPETKFQPALPARGATKLASEICAHSTISTRAPREGSDPVADGRADVEPFQPALPARGATCATFTTSQPFRFQPALPARGRPSLRCSRTALSNFNPRSPRGERLSVLRRIPLIVRFQPALPARGATVALGRAETGRDISTRAPREGSDPRPPARGSRVAISTRAPREGSDTMLAHRGAFLFNFNPRSPRGERQQISPSSQKQNSAISPNFASNYNKNSFVSRSKAYFLL